VGDASDSSVSTGFPATRWSLVLAAGDNESAAATEAMEGLCQLYWKPVYGYIRASQRSPEDALDLTQGFFAHLINGDVIRRADQRRGRFRSFILVCLRDYLCDERRRVGTQKRGGDWRRIDGDVADVEEWLGAMGSSKRQPDVIYEVSCAMALMNEAMRLLHEECDRSDRARLFEVLRPYLQGDAAAPSYEETARLLNTTPGTVRVTVHQLRKRHRRLVRSIVAQTLADPLAVDDELRSLREALSTVA
jgi:RNA polymerase sigma-70 factor (ECF subfamily)